MKCKSARKLNLIQLMLLGISPCTATIATAQELRQANAHSGLEEVIVSARRRDESVQEVPISVSALTAESLQNLSIGSPLDLSMHTPSLSFTSSGGGAT